MKNERRRRESNKKPIMMYDMGMQSCNHICWLHPTEIVTVRDAPLWVGCDENAPGDTDSMKSSLFGFESLGVE